MVNLTQESPQGPAQARGLDTGGFIDAVLRSRPGVAYGESRAALAPLPSEVINVIADAPGSFVAQQFAGASCAGEAAKTGTLASMTDGFPGPQKGSI